MNRIAKEELERLIDQKLTANGIGEIVGMSGSGVRKYLKLYGLETARTVAIRQLQERKCAGCEKPTRNPRFCSSSCSARITNSEAPRRRKMERFKCEVCEKAVGHREHPSRRRAVHKACLSAATRAAFEARWKAGERDISRGKGHNRRLRWLARQVLLHRAKRRCERCGWGEVNPYTGRVPLETDHVNGDPFDDRYENVAVLCPNCHALTSTYKGANKGKGRVLGLELTATCDSSVWSERHADNVEVSEVQILFAGPCASS